MRELSIEEIESEEVSGGAWPAVIALIAVIGQHKQIEDAAKEFFEGYGEARNK
jgi:hypothetical protein